MHTYTWGATGSPVLVSTTTGLSGSNGNYKGFAVIHGNKIIDVQDKWINIIDISNPSSANVLSSTSFQGGSGQDCGYGSSMIFGDYVIMDLHTSAGSSSTTSNLYIIDISNPYSPSQVATINRAIATPRSAGSFQYRGSLFSIDLLGMVNIQQLPRLYVQNASIPGLDSKTIYSSSVYSESMDTQRLNVKIGMDAMVVNAGWMTSISLNAQQVSANLITGIVSANVTATSLGFNGTTTTNAGTALLGDNSPASSLSSPAAWIPINVNGSIMYLPAWQ